ncbi:EmrB/QacA subfamily drug resistance transporter [Kibdelosporangium banguiense]|uniref:EmrB/QacA subfamily drug resistance transporter n=1 Tax=Kibdelosporangium banguiense TaxID=1365924 RepID=A0ABS4TU08_9PSEU|nr:MFS transporter [Kibdelosporangium banguiense]MBP2327892.1 EmrB/QacA subfamily drug resistance transporter [Kibdelosporangium banguiense]
MTMNSAATAQAPGGERQRWLMLIVLLTGQFMALLAVTVVNVAIPSIQQDLHTSGSTSQLIVAGYTLTYAMFLITGARLGELYGRRRIFLIGVIGFTITSLLSGLAPSAGVLVAARLVNGVGAALMMPQIMTTIQTQFAAQARAKALSAYAAVIAVGGVCGTVIGGLLVSADLLHSGWRPVFLVNVPIGIVVAALVPKLVPPDEPAPARRLDLVGLAVSMPAVCLIVLPLVLGHELHWPAWTFVSLVAGALLAALFVVVERRIEHPLMNLAVLRVPGAASGLATLAAGMIAYGGFLFTTSVHLQIQLGDSPLRTGLTFAPSGVLFGLCGYYWRRLPARSHHLLVPIGFAVGAAGYLITAILLADRPSSLVIAASLLVFAVGVGTAFGPLMTHTLVNVPATSAADASGLVTTTLQLGQVVGVAIFGSLYLTLTTQAITTTLSWIAALTAVGAIVAIALARTTWRATRQTGD